MPSPRFVTVLTEVQAARQYVEQGFCVRHGIGPARCRAALAGLAAAAADALDGDPDRVGAARNDAAAVRDRCGVAVSARATAAANADRDAQLAAVCGGDAAAANTATPADALREHRIGPVAPRGDGATVGQADRCPHDRPCRPLPPIANDAPKLLFALLADALASPAPPVPPPPPTLCANTPKASWPRVATSPSLVMVTAPPVPPVPPAPPTATASDIATPSCGPAGIRRRRAVAPVPPPPPIDCAMTPIAPSPAVVISPELSSPTVPAVLPLPPLPPIAAESEMAGNVRVAARY